jgi:glucose/arabinose dehydrogenase
VAIDLRTNVDDTGEGGLLGVAFHPNFASNRFVYLSFTETSTQVGTALVSYVSRFKASADGSTLDKNSRLDILKVNQPFSNHNGGNISFGPDGYLYVGFGDGGNANDPLNNAQNKSVLLGKMLRINVNSGSPYSIPADNPFANGGGAPEVFAYGLRNPWRWNFDTATGKLWVADVGQSFAEEINIVEKGGNYGWVCREGLKINKPSACSATETYIDPVNSYGRSEGASVTGGFVYRGSAIPKLYGHYVFADFVEGKIWYLSQTNSSQYVRTLAIDSNFNISHIAQGNDGELYVVDYDQGGFYKIVPKQ